MSWRLIAKVCAGLGAAWMADSVIDAAFPPKKELTKGGEPCKQESCQVETADEKKVEKPDSGPAVKTEEPKGMSGNDPEPLAETPNTGEEQEG